MEISDIIKQQKFWENQRKAQTMFVVETQAPVIAEYFEDLQKVNKNDNYKKILFDLINELFEGQTFDTIQEVIKKYKAIMDPYVEKIAKIERGDSDIRLYEYSDLELTKSRIEPVMVICNFIDNLIYGGFNVDEIKTYLRMWKEKAQINAVEASRTAISENGRHQKNPYREIDEKY